MSKICYIGSKCFINKRERNILTCIREKRKRRGKWRERESNKGRSEIEGVGNGKIERRNKLREKNLKFKRERQLKSVELSWGMSRGIDTQVS
jgi:hypothetical protein